MPQEMAATESRSGSPLVRLRAFSQRDRIGQRHIGAGDRGGAGAAIGFEHVAIERDLVLAQRLHVDHGAQRAADQALDFLRAADLLAGGGLAAGAGAGGARQHAVFGGDPAEALAATPRRQAWFRPWR